MRFNSICCVFCYSNAYIWCFCAANKAFKSDSQRLAVSLRSSIAKRHSHLNAALAVLWSQYDDYN
ncbi:hypothetical protein CGI46_23500 [Vibrio parahaemolyticus]|nr:hypothetical protein CGI46_23500 [Vibrio parahaemolyticus]